MDYTKLTDDELEEEIAKKFGEDWTFEMLETDEELCKEFTNRIATGK